METETQEDGGRQEKMGRGWEDRETDRERLGKGEEPPRKMVIHPTHSVGPGGCGALGSQLRTRQASSSGCRGGLGSGHRVGWEKGALSPAPTLLPQPPSPVAGMAVSEVRR